MPRPSEKLMNNFNEMELLSRALGEAYIYCLPDNINLASAVDQARIFLLNAAIDWATDLGHKIHRHINKDNIINHVIVNLTKAENALSCLPCLNQKINFTEMEMEIGIIKDYAKEYAIKAYQMIDNFSDAEKKILSNKIFIIKSRRTI